MATFIAVADSPGMSTPDLGSPRLLEGGPASYWLGAMPDFALAVVFAIAWLRPDLLTPEKLRLLLVSMLLEFIVMHSGAMMGGAYAAGDSVKSRLGMMATLAVFYSIFAAAFSAAFHTWWPFLSFWLLMLNRMLVVLLDPRPRPEKTQLVMANWGFTALAYLGWVFGTAMPPIPRMGMTSAVVESMHLEGGGLWIDEPWRVMAMGAGYFATIGIVEVTILPRIAAAGVGRLAGGRVTRTR